MSRTLLTANTTWYIDLAGNDSTGDGSSGNPWATAQYAIEKIQKNYDMAGFTPTLQINDGDWYVPGGLNTFCSGNGPLVGANAQAVAFNIQGNIATPSNCKIHLAAGQYGFSAGNSFVGGLYGFDFICPTSVAGAIPILATTKGSWDISNIIFNTNYQQVNVYATNSGTILANLNAPISVLGNMGDMFAAQAGSNIQVAATINIPSALTFAYWGQCIDRSGINFTSATYTGAGVSGCVGTKGYAQLCSDILVNGNFTTSAPGNTAYGHDSTSAIA